MAAELPGGGGINTEPKGPPAKPAAGPKPRNRRMRRITYLLAAGGLAAGAGAWLVRQPFVGDYALRKAGEFVMEETGLSFEARKLEVSLFSGLVAVDDIRLGGDLLRIHRLEIQGGLFTLFGGQPNIHRILVSRPELRLDAKRLAGLKLKPHPPRKEPWPQARLDVFELKDGSIEIREPEWGLPQANSSFAVHATGLGPNRLRVEFKATEMAMKAPGGFAKGHAEITADLSATLLRLLKAEVEFGHQKLQASGTFEPKSGRISAKSKSILDLASAMKLGLPASKRATSGQLMADLGVEGTFGKPNWDLHLLSHKLNPGVLDLHAGKLELKAGGNLQEARLRAFTWLSEDGDVAMEGEWKKGLRTAVKFQAAKVDLNPLAAFSRVGQAKDLHAFIEAEAALRGNPWGKGLRLDLLQAQAVGRFQRSGSSVGDFKATLENSQVNLSSLNLRLEDLDVQAQGSGRVAAKSIEDLKVQGRIETDAAKVATALRAWDVIDLDMAGRVVAKADLSIHPSSGVQLNGDLAVAKPRWHGASADRLEAKVQLRGSALDIQDIVVAEGEGRGHGDIWLTWAQVPAGGNQFDACFRVSRLPISGGLKAADQGDLPIEGTASGWARIWGPFDALQMRGDGLAEHAVAYELSIPAAWAEFRMDLAKDRITLPEFRIAESPGALSLGDAAPQGALALKGRLELDLNRNAWWGDFGGTVDSSLLAVPGPRLQAEVSGHVEGPWENPFGPMPLPNGAVKFSRARVFAGDQSLENLEGFFQANRGAAEGWIAQGGAAAKILELAAFDDDGVLRTGGHLRLDATSIDTPQLAARLTQDLMEDVRLDSDFSATWEPEGFHWQGRVNQLLARFPAFDLTQAQPAFVHGNLDGIQIDLPLEARERAANRAGAAPTTGHLALHGLVPFSTTGPLALQAKGSADLGELKTILDGLMEVDPYSLLADLQPSGSTKVDLQLQGTPADPLLDGTLQVEGGRIRVRTYPQSAENINVTAHFHGREISIPESAPLQGQLAQGSLTAWGTALWQLGGLASYDLKANLFDFQLRDVPAGFEVGGSLKARLSGNDEDGGLLKGTIQAERMIYRADINLTDILLNSTTGTTALSSFDPDDPLARIKLDLDLKLNQPWRFDTNLLKLEGIPQGSFKVLGTLARPGLKGKMEFIPGGSLTNLLPAGDVTVERGSIDFSDPMRFNPFINMQGRIDVPPYLVNLSITGRVDQLTVALSSTPSLRQDEITAILVDPAAAPVIGSTLGGSSQSALNYGIASAGSGLIGTLALANFQEQLRRTFNLDRLSVSPRTGATGTAEVSITAGKSFDFLGRRTPLLYTYHRAGELITHSGKAEWRFGNYVLQFGLSRAGYEAVNLTGEIRHTWSPK
ncbi:MAG: translocation/assembly module TamB domain-containing protein [Holophagaceae bacterium]|nr:translocation/assembly module TamB domain-containing protein [Holophagaceae bacterium]